MLTPKLQEALDAVNASRSVSAAARALGISRTTLRERLDACARQGHSPGLAPASVPEGFRLSRTTVQLDAKGNVTQEWRRVAPVEETLEAVTKALEARVEGKAPAQKAHGRPAGDLLLELPVADLHMGMLAWGKEGGEDYDCASARDLLLRGTRSMLAAPGAPVSKVAIITLGDYYHSDNRQGTTERSGNALDMDSRFSKRVDAGIAALSGAVELAAEQSQVELIVLSGNHDWHSAKWLARVLSAYYRNDKRVVVRTDPRARQYLQHGKVLLGYSHGDLVKPHDLPQIMAQEQPDAWAKTIWRRWRLGHLHQRKVYQSRTVYDHPGVLVEHLPTLAAADAYAHENGFMSSRALTSYLWSAEFGLRAQFERSPQELA